jgi:hypothetical protein
MWSTDGQTDGPTDRQTDISKTIYPLFFEGGHIYHYVKYEDFVINTFQDNQQKPCGLPQTDRRTDRQTDRQTDISKTIYPLFFEGGHNYTMYHFSPMYSFKILLLLDTKL